MFRTLISSEFFRLYRRVTLNEFLVHMVAGVAAGFFLAFVQVIRLRVVPEFLLYGFVALAPLYTIHLVRSYHLLKKSFVLQPAYVDMDLRQRLKRLQEIASCPGRIGSFVLILWTWGGLYTAFFSWRVLELPTYLVLFSGATIFLMGPLIWLVDMVVLKRILLRTIRRYMNAIPESTQAGLSFYRFSTLTKGLLAVIYLVFVAMYLVVQTAATSFNRILENQLRTMTMYQLNTAAALLVEMNGDDFDQRAAAFLTSYEPIRGMELKLRKEDGSQIGSIRQETSAGLSFSMQVDVPDVGTLYAQVPTPSSAVVHELIQRGIGVFSILLFSVGLIVLLQVGRDYRGTIHKLEQMAGAIAEGDLEKRDGFFSTDEFWRVYQRLLVIKSNSGRVLSGIRDSSITVTEMVRITEDVSRFLQSLAVEQARMIQNAADALLFIEGFGDRVRSSITDLSTSAETTSSTVMEFAAAVNQIKNSMNHLVSMAERVSGWVNESGTVISDMNRGVKTIARFSESLQNTMDKTSRFVSGLDFELTGIDDAFRSMNVMEHEQQELIRSMENEVAALGKIFQEHEAARGNLGNQLDELAKLPGLLQAFMDEVEILSLNTAIIESRSEGEASSNAFALIGEEIRELILHTSERAGAIRDRMVDFQKQMAVLENTLVDVPTRLMGFRDLIRVALRNTQVSSGKAEEQAVRVEKLARESTTNAKDLMEVLQSVKENNQQIQHLYQGLEQHEHESRTMLETSEEMKAMAEQVMEATQEQTTGANHIATASETIKDLSMTAREAVGKLKETMGELVEMLEVLRNNSDASMERSERLRQVVDQLGEQAASLTAELARFRLGKRDSD